LPDGTIGLRNPSICKVRDGLLRRRILRRKDRRVSDTDKTAGEGGPKERDAGGKTVTNDPALQKESRQAVKNQSSVEPEQYPDRGETPV
jgi:hypothetical protein